MEKMKKICLPICIVLGVLIVVMIGLIVGVKISGNKTEEVAVEDGTESAAVSSTQSTSLVSDVALDDYESYAGDEYANEAVSTETSTEDGAILEDADPLNNPDAYIIADSDWYELTDEDLEGLTAQELTYARYEIYARYGVEFNSTELSDYFNGKSWYVADDDLFEVDSVELTDMEDQNFNFIAAYQESNDLIYELD